MTSIEVRPTGTPAAELPMGMVYEVAQVLAVHGLDLDAAGKADPKVWTALLMALGSVIDAVPVEHGGRAEP